VFVGLTILCILLAVVRHRSVEAVRRAESDKSQLQGSWHVVSAHVAGEAIDYPHPYFTFDGDKLFWLDDTGQEWLFALDASKSPPQIDLVPNASDLVEYHGIYAVQKNTLKLCLGRSYEPRPTRFESTRKDVHVLMFLNRENATAD
jgi:uncharacterized protein (TIGR03067 family)